MSDAQLAEDASRLLGRRLGREPGRVWFAPGRVNLVGEHTDYNDGFVLPLALAQGTAAAVAARDDHRLRVASTSTSEVVEVDLDDVGPGHPAGWGSYVAGVVWALREDGAAVLGLDVAVAGDLPLGAGLSSSASMACAVAAATADLVGWDADRTRLALAAHRAETVVAGVPCGVMDQMAAMHARAGHLLELDTRSLRMQHVPLDLTAADLEMLVIDTRTERRLAEAAYADRRSSCEQASRLLRVRALRDVTDLDAALASLGTQASLRRRVRHVVTENARVLAVVDLLRAGADPRLVGPALTESHVSLRTDYEVSAPALDLAVDAALGAGAHGARMTGGGFGGCVVALLDAAEHGRVVAAVEAAFASSGWAAPRARSVAPSAGARRLA